MPKNLLIIFGIVIAIMPFLGFPGTFKSPVYFILGVAVAYFGYFENHSKRKPVNVRRMRKSKEVVSVPVEAPPKNKEATGTVITSLLEPHEEVKTKQ